MQKKQKIFGAVAGLFLVVLAISLYLAAYNNSFRIQLLSLSRAFADLDISCQRFVPYAPEEGRFVIYGDSRDGYETHIQLINLMLDKKPKIVFNTGDLVNDGNKLTDWIDFNGISSELRRSTRFFPILGNHEKDSPLFHANFELPGNEEWYSLNSNGVHFVVLNSNKDLTAGSQQYRWLENDLKSQDRNDFTILILHHPPFSTGKHGGDEMHLQKSVVPLFEKYGVDAVFSGHDHDYERSFVKGVYYIVTGGGGAPLYSQMNGSKYSQKFLQIYHYCLLEKVGEKLKVNVYNLEDKSFDEFFIKNR